MSEYVYKSLQDVVENYVAENLGSHAENYDLMAIAEEVSQRAGHGYVITISDDSEYFWDLVEQHML